MDSCFRRNDGMSLSNTTKTDFIDYFCSVKSFGRGIPSILILLTWLIVVIFVSTKHELWRDEVRALSIALEPASFWNLPTALGNEGHPVLWYLILRIVFEVAHTPVTLMIVSICIAFTSITIFYRYAPFPIWQKFLFIWGVLPIYEYCVMARNYGISMLLFFLFATLYTQKKKRPFLLACVLVLISNTNVHSCILAGVLSVMWFFDDVVTDYHSLNYRRTITLICAFVFIGAGILFCIATTLPSQDTIVTNAFSLKVSQVTEAVCANIRHPGMHFRRVFPYLNDSMRDVLMWSLAACLLIRPHIAVSLSAGIVLLGTFFSIGYHGSLRHQGIFIVFMISLYWIVYQQITVNAKGKLRRQFHFMYKASVYIVLSAIFILHIVISAHAIRVDISEERSSSRAFGKFLVKHSEYNDAIIMGEPDYILESLPYYVSNQIYIPRERRFGNAVKFTKAGRAKMSLSELLDIAQQIRESEKTPVIIAIGHLDLSDQKAYKKSYSYNKIFSWSDEELAVFRSQTIKIADFRNSVRDENYEIYLLSSTARNNGGFLLPQE